MEQINKLQAEQYDYEQYVIDQLQKELDYTQEKLNKIISALRYFTDDVFKIKTLSAIGDKLLPYVVDQMITNPDFVIKLPSTDSTILDYVLNESLAEINGIK